MNRFASHISVVSLSAIISLSVEMPLYGLSASTYNVIAQQKLDNFIAVNSNERVSDQ